MAGLVADRRLYLSADKARVLEDGDPEAAYLLAPAGRVIPAPDAERLGLRLSGGKIAWGPEPEPEPVPVPDAPVEGEAPKRRNKGRA